MMVNFTIVVGAIAVLLVIVFIWPGDAVFKPDNKQMLIDEGALHTARPETIKLMEKHGPDYLYEIDKGVMYLHRDGQRIEVGRVR